MQTCNALARDSEDAQANADQHEQQAIEIAQRLRVHGANYVDEAPPPSYRKRRALSIRHRFLPRAGASTSERGRHSQGFQSSAGF